jgi:hypothetical protein
MKKYYKDNQKVNRPKVLIYEDKVYPNPSDELIQQCGYTIVEDNRDSPANRLIRQERQNAYEKTADKYLCAYQAYKELGNQEAAEEMK